MTASIGVENMATPRALGSVPSGPVSRQMAMETPSEKPRLSASFPRDRVDLRSDHIPVHLTLRAAAHRSTASAAKGELSAEEQVFVRELQARDREVRAHEQAHASVGGIYASAPTYDYVTGPDGQRYAVGGEVKIDVSPVPDNPEATIDKMIVVKQAALAPREPSTQDRRVARTADQYRQVAEADLRDLRAQARTQAEDLETAEPLAAQRPDDDSFASRLFTDVSSLYREAADFLAMPTDDAAAGVFA